MSRIDSKNRISNPVEYILKWGAKKGNVELYDKKTKEKKFVKSLNFVVLDRKITITGYLNDVNYRGTEVNTVNDPIQVQSKVKGGSWKNKEVAPYTELKDKKYVKYTQVLYVGIINRDKTLTIAKLYLVGSSNGAFIDFTQGKKGTSYEGDGKVENIYTVIIGIKGKDKKKVVNDSAYYPPLFTTFELEDDLSALADEEAQKVVDFLSNFDGTNKEEEEEKVSENTSSRNDASNGESQFEDGADDYEEDKEEEEDEFANGVDDLPF